MRSFSKADVKKGLSRSRNDHHTNHRKKLPHASRHCGLNLVRYARILALRRRLRAEPCLFGWLVSDIYKANVYDNFENKLGDVTDLVLDNDGNVMMAVLGVGGDLGASQKEVAVPFKDLKISSRDGKDWLVPYRTKDDLKNAPGYDKKSETNKV